MALLVRTLVPANGSPNVVLVDTDAQQHQLLQDIVQLFCRVNCNAFTIADDTGASLGLGLFPHGALFNHSCAPNCVVSFAGQDMRVHTIADVDADTELTVRRSESVREG